MQKEKQKTVVIFFYNYKHSSGRWPEIPSQCFIASTQQASSFVADTGIFVELWSTNPKDTVL